MMIVFALNCRRGLLRESNGLERFAENHLTAGIASAVHADQTRRTSCRQSSIKPSVAASARSRPLRPGLR